MTEKELLTKLKEFQGIKPNSDWANWLLNNILSQKKEQVSIKPRVTWASFSFLRHYQKVLIPSFFIFIFASTFVFAQNTLPGNPLYAVKTFTQNARIVLAPKDYKPVIRLQIAKSRLEDMAKVSDQEKEIALMSQNIKKDLATVPQELKAISKKQVALKVSQQVQQKTQEISNIVQQTNLENKDKDELEQTVQETQNQVLALIIQTTEEINQCPSFLQTNLNNLQQYFTDNINFLASWPADDITKIKVYIADISNDMKAGNCLEAMEKMESINQIIKIHSLDVQVENLAPTPESNSGSGGSTPESSD
ncbi:MAG: hypothetical protein GYA31_02365 [Parcubacteria group bacterium]|nr:hypothetical protein [Parcubacteria group bacterium]